MGAFLDLNTTKGDKAINAKKVRNLSATKRKARAYEQKEAIENTYSMRIERSTNQRDQRRAMRLFSALCFPCVALLLRSVYTHCVRIFYGFLLRLCALLPIGCVKVSNLCCKAFLLPLLSAKI